MSCCSGGKSGKHKCRCVQNNAGGRRQTSGYDRKQRCGNLQKFLHLSRASPPSQSVSISPSNSVNRRRWSADRPDNNFKLSSFLWSYWPDLNRRPADYENYALCFVCVRRAEECVAPQQFSVFYRFVRMRTIRRVFTAINVK